MQGNLSGHTSLASEERRCDSPDYFGPTSHDQFAEISTSITTCRTRPMSGFSISLYPPIIAVQFACISIL